ncbi:hypothetical protein SAMN05444487_12015 [Marininema mesophilum]|uniref:Uncharacterized protein n=1 Tax=Marininema mesophilum TaxID=1048340 RepID=A0A1H3C562_9BACL|nr:hypothetical protein SAMN05444487_12015 [Marininema mesophilum]
MIVVAVFSLPKIIKVILWRSSLVIPPTGANSVYNESASSDFLTDRMMHMNGQITLSIPLDSPIPRLVRDTKSSL